MNKKILIIVICTLLISNSVVLFYENETVKAGEGGGGTSIQLDYDYVWSVLRDLCNVTYNANWSKENDIVKGRAWATEGENCTINTILIPEMENNCSLSGVKKLQIGYIDRDGYRDREYSSKVVTNNYQLIINNASDAPYTYLWRRGSFFDFKQRITAYAVTVDGMSKGTYLDVLKIF